MTPSEAAPMKANKTEYDMVGGLRSAIEVSEFHERIADQQARIDRLMRWGWSTKLAVKQLTELQDTLSHLRHHQSILSISLSPRRTFVS